MTKGFTLVEILVAVTILSILTAVGITTYGSMQERARDAKRKLDIEAISQAFEVNYNSKTGIYVTPAAEQFANKLFPNPPRSGDYKHALGTDNYSFIACTKLEVGASTTACDAPDKSTCGLTTGNQCYCCVSSRGVTPTGIAF